MRLAWIIQGPFTTSSSYYQQSHLFTRRLNDFGHTSHIIHITSIKEDRSEMLRQIKNFQADLTICFGDIHFTDLAEQSGIPNLSWVINGTGIVPLKENIPNTTFPCMSHFAQKLLQKAGISQTPYLPLAFDPNVFHPGRRNSARARLGWNYPNPSVLMISTNYSINPKEKSFDLKMDRKNWLGGLEAFADLLKILPDVRLFIHSNEKGAVDLPGEVKRLSIQKAVGFSDQRFYSQGVWNRPASYIADLYRASNVLLFTSIGEGFGIPLIEAQACGIPVVTTDGGPMKELTVTGTAVKSNSHPAFPAWRTPDKKALVEALKKLRL